MFFAVILMDIISYNSLLMEDYFWPW